MTMQWNGLIVKRIEFDDVGHIISLEFYEGAGLTNVMKAVTQYSLNGGSRRAILDALILEQEKGEGTIQYPPDPKQDAS
jgi:hypothetical protein